MSETQYRFSPPDSIGPIVHSESNLDVSPKPMNSSLRRFLLIAAYIGPLLAGTIGAITQDEGVVIFAVMFHVQVFCWLGGFVFQKWSYHRRHEIHIGMNGFSLFMVYGTFKNPSITTIHWAAVEQIQTKMEVTLNKYGRPGGNYFRQTWIGANSKVLAKFKLWWGALFQFDGQAATIYRSLRKAEAVFSQIEIWAYTVVMDDVGELAMPASRNGKHSMIISPGRLVLIKRSKVVFDLSPESIAGISSDDNGGIMALVTSQGRRRFQTIVRGDCPNKNVALALIGKYFHSDFAEYSV